MRYLVLIRDVAWSYLYGFFMGNLVFLPLTNILVFVTFIFGMLLTLPLLFVVLVIVLVFNRNIERHPLPWCCVTPLVVTIGWVILEQHVFFDRQEVGFERYLFDIVAWLRAALAFTCAAFAARKFYLLNRRVGMRLA